MQATIISDTSCLILLDKIGELDLLQKLFGEVIITQTIADEFDKQRAGWLRVQNPIGVTSQLVLETVLDKGEASAIALALEMRN